MTFVLSRQLFQSLISDRSKSVIEYELKKFDKLNKRKMNQFKKFSIQQEKTKIEKMIQLGHELKESAQKKQLIKEKNLIMTTKGNVKKESISIVVGAVDQAMHLRSQQIAYKSSSVKIVTMCLQEALFQVERRAWGGGGGGGGGELQHSFSEKDAMNRGVLGRRLYPINFDSAEEEDYERSGGGSGSGSSGVMQRWMGGDMEEQNHEELFESWSIALETDRQPSINSTMLEQIEKMSEISLGSYGDDLNDEDWSMMKVAEYELLHADMSKMITMGIFEHLTNNEYDTIEQELWKELMEDDEYRHWEDEEDEEDEDGRKGKKKKKKREEKIVHYQRKY